MKELQNAGASQVAEAIRKQTSLALGQPFDLARSFYALAVRLGVIERSLLGSARFGRDISSLEKMALGPWARQV
jgi:hypothetical protein